MCTVEQCAVDGNFGEFVHEDNAASAKSLDDGAVVDDFVVNVDRAAEKRECPFEALDRHIDASAKTPRVCQDNLHRAPPWLWLWYLETTTSDNRGRKPASNLIDNTCSSQEMSGYILDWELPWICLNQLSGCEIEKRDCQRPIPELF